ncbi:hypothetical protein SporoP37_02025 [Sporosarcina sp. P37]|uniref:hypothetical protein n=1 Tax=unclassified Sporosarcina TaxID=2647733 RepID=UPI000A17DD12|nr:MULTISPECIES: hypothetical protein [unclassified Sporosarcina]ARK23588.1 hypothetical protein SporoP37_02025 [Sporosarcina sp. P37]PID18789.1 hypothetical protein CSV62_06725 [Sporosarcina sp. P35]
MTERKTATGIRTVAMKTITCIQCGDEQQTQVGSVCHRDSLCVMCANNNIKRPRKFGKKFEVQ